RGRAKRSVPTNLFQAKIGGTAQARLCYVGLYNSRHLVERPIAIDTAARFFSDSAPLLEEECRSRLPARSLDLVDPFFKHRTRSRPALAADDRPMDRPEIGGRHRSQQRLERNEPDCGSNPAQVVNAAEIVGALHAGAEPYVGK